MLKKHLLLVLMLLLAVATASAGTWKIHNYYVTSQIQNVFDVLGRDDETEIDEALQW